MRIYQFDNEADGRAFATAVDSSLGYPNAETKTDNYAVLWTRPDGLAWGYTSDETVDATVQQNNIPFPSPNPVEVDDAVWFPPPVT